MTKFSAELGPVGIDKVIVDGHDVTNQVAAIEVAGSPNHPSRIALWANADGTVEGDAILTAVSGDISEAAAFVRGLDAAAVQTEALNKLEWGADDLAQAWLDTIADRIAEGPG